MAGRRAVYTGKQSGFSADVANGVVLDGTMRSVLSESWAEEEGDVAQPAELHVM